MATVTLNTTREFSDLDLNFTIHPIRKDINRTTGDMAVINSIKNLVLTNHYERPFQPEVGSNVRRLLFENLDNLTASSIEKEIEQVIKNFEPRARITKVNAIADFENNGFKVSMEFFVVNKTSPITINFFLERIR
jgi:phage baseplate assembly protein W